MVNGRNVNRLLNRKKSDEGKYRTNIYVTEEIYRQFQQTCKGMGLTVTEALDALMADFTETNSPRELVSSAPKKLPTTGPD